MSVTLFCINANSKKLSTLYLACVCIGLGACERIQAASPASNSTEEVGGTRVNHGESASPGLDSGHRGNVIAVKRLDGNPQAAVSITYRASQSNPVCVLKIIERGRVVAENSNMIECGLVSAPGMVDVTLSGTTQDLTVFQQMSKQTNSYSLQRSDDGEWIVTKAEFVYPRDNVETGEVDVVRETADLTQSRPQILVNKFERVLIDSRLVMSIVQ